MFKSNSSSITFYTCENGIFINDNQQHNGKVYLRHYLEEDNEIYDEKVCVGRIDS